ncbi:uncharacterized protein Z520_11703 [Fonsecaea multimorphosa CBS 102226]|uniref:cAMP-dependent protein kinase n=1 Tax=Fonsecaea multimorphosa CBS 102226 TaxID=1442371 RepID=A0A0D2JH74_9EURO|nr:uncharacterized protein Z520_11703 [Fonsecaea multimorphosa CBS 102226]KIX92527.1 hypothetical protein Z520_11703 [Fonsecaea multimorphosa CBS 102226]
MARQRFPNSVAKYYAAGVFLAIEYLRSKDIIDRSIKPENMSLDQHGHVKLIDFGEAKHVPNGTGTLCGTLEYIAPEIIVNSNKGKYTKCADWWSGGILIFEMLSGHTPFQAGDEDSPMEFYEKLLGARFNYPPYIHPDVEYPMHQVLVPDPECRLGNKPGDTEGIKKHRWFAEDTWDRLLRKDIDGPYIPPIQGEKGDASKFDRYDEEDSGGEEEGEE